MMGAYMDWLAHLAASPGKQQELVSKALRKSARLALHSLRCGTGTAKPCIDPLPQDRRFTARSAAVALQPDLPVIPAKTSSGGATRLAACVV